MDIDIRTLSKLLIKLFGLYLLVEMIIQIPLLFAAFDPRTMSINNVLYVAVMLLLAILFIWFPGITVNGLLRIRGDQIAGAGGGRLAFRTGVALLGLYYCFKAISGLALTLIFF